MPSRGNTDASDRAGSEATDLELVERARAADARAMDELVRRHHGAVARLLWSFVRTRADLEDLVQETFLRMVRGLPSWRADRPFSHWLLRLATNTGRDHFRRQAVRRRWFAHSLQDDRGTLPTEPVASGADPGARAAAEEVKERLALLPPDDRLLLTLHYLEGWNLAEIAPQLGWTVTATKLRAWRARRRLRALLETPSP